jgi:hypothetical protein
MTGTVSEPLSSVVGINVDAVPQPHRLAERGW